jgi:hypothetical protein
MKYMTKMASANLESIGCDKLQKKIVDMNRNFHEDNSMVRILILFDEADS